MSHGGSCQWGSAAYQLQEISIILRHRQHQSLCEEALKYDLYRLIHVYLGLGTLNGYLYFDLYFDLYWAKNFRHQGINQFYVYLVMQLAVKFIFYVIDTLQAPVEDGSLCYGLPCPDPGTLHQCPANENKARAFYIGMLYIPPNNCLYKSSTNVG